MNRKLDKILAFIAHQAFSIAKAVGILSAYMPEHLFEQRTIELVRRMKNKNGIDFPQKFVIRKKCFYSITNGGAGFVALSPVILKESFEFP